MGQANSQPRNRKGPAYPRLRFISYNLNNLHLALYQALYATSINFTRLIKFALSMAFSRFDLPSLALGILKDMLILILDLHLVINCIGLLMILLMCNETYILILPDLPNYTEHAI